MQSAKLLQRSWSRAFVRLEQYTTMANKQSQYSINGSCPDAAGSSLSATGSSIDASQFASSATEAFQSGDFKLALDNFKLAAREQPRSADAFFNIGTSNCMLLNWQEAVDAFESSIALDDKHSDALVNCANVLAAHLGQPDKALEYLLKATTISPYDGEIRFNYGVVLQANNRLANAIDQYQQAVDLGVGRALENLRNATAQLAIQDDAKQED